VTGDEVCTGKGGEDGKKHADWLVAVKLELVVAAPDVDDISHFEHGLETNALFTNISFLPAADVGSLGALAQPRQSIDLVERESDFIAVGAEILAAIPLVER
jgi:hypothetical protein